MPRACRLSGARNAGSAMSRSMPNVMDRTAGESSYAKPSLVMEVRALRLDVASAQHVLWPFRLLDHRRQPEEPP